MMENEIDCRSQMLLGEEGLKKVQNSEVAVFGLGGVGGTAFEFLLRTGIKTIHAVDMDKVDPSNLNRQILFNKDDIGKSKALVAVSFSRKIREDVVVIPEEYRVSEESLNEHDYSSCSFFIDAIDDIEAKVALISYAEKHNIKIVVSLGMGNRLDPSTIYLTVLSKTEGDPLAKKLRSCCRKKGIDLSNIVCVASKEEPLVRGAKPSSLMGVPSGAGLLMASYVISSLDKE